MKRFFIPLTIIILVGGIFYHHFYQENKSHAASLEIYESNKPAERVVKVPIEPGVTFSELMEQAGINTSMHQAIYSSAYDIYDLADIRASDSIELTFDQETDELVQLIYQIDTLHELYVTRQATEEVLPVEGQQSTSLKEYENNLKTTGWVAKKRLINYDVKTKIVSGTINSSLYETGLELGMDERAIIALAEVFQWEIDFAWGIRAGDTFTVIYEERYRNGEYIMPGKILAARFDNNGAVRQAYYFEESEDRKGYYDEEGNSTQKIFLKAPLAFKYISSGFTNKKRFVSSALGWTSSHKAIDYAATYGNPVRAVGDGTVISAGWNSQGYGNRVSISHNETYTTNYAHLSKIYVKYGEHVEQGDIIGAVGSTGFSSGPHLHYEMVKHGVKINPLNEELPSGTLITAERKDRFFEEIGQYQSQLFL